MRHTPWLMCLVYSMLSQLVGKPARPHSFKRLFLFLLFSVNQSNRKFGARTHTNQRNQHIICTLHVCGPRTRRIQNLVRLIIGSAMGIYVLYNIQMCMNNNVKYSLMPIMSPCMCGEHQSYPVWPQYNHLLNEIPNQHYFYSPMIANRRDADDRRKVAGWVGLGFGRIGGSTQCILPQTADMGFTVATIGDQTPIGIPSWPIKPVMADIIGVYKFMRNARQIKSMLSRLRDWFHFTYGWHFALHRIAKLRAWNKFKEIQHPLHIGAIVVLPVKYKCIILPIIEHIVAISSWPRRFCCHRCRSCRRR